MNETNDIELPSCSPSGRTACYAVAFAARLRFGVPCTDAMYDCGARRIVPENQRTLIDECNVYEWIDYWQTGNNQWKVDSFDMNEHTRLELAFASKVISHMLATLRDIVDCPLEVKPEHADAVRMAKNALAEYGL